MDLRGLPLPGRRAADEGPVHDGYVDHAIFQPAAARRVLQQRVRPDRRGVRPRADASGQADLQPQLRPAQRRGRPRPAARGRRAVRPQGRQALHRRVARRLPRLASSTTRGPTATSRRAASSASATSTSTRARRSGRSTATPSTWPTSTTWPPTSPTSTSSSSTVGLPRLEDFCWIATQEPNVHGGLAVAMPFIHTRPRYFAQIIGELLYWIGEDRIQFSSDYALVDAALADREVRRLPDPRGPGRVRADHHRSEEEDPRPQRREDVRHPGARRAAAARRPTRPRPVRASPSRRPGEGADDVDRCTDAVAGTTTAYAAPRRRDRPRARRADHRPRVRPLAGGRRRPGTSRCTCGCRRRSARRTSPT